MTSHASVASVAATLAEDWILSGKYAPGDKLPSERKLAEELGVSRPLLREALRGLMERRLIEISPGRGAFVRDSSVTDVSDGFTTLLRRQQATTGDILVARRMIECESAETAARTATPTDLAQMLKSLEECEQASDILGRVRADLRFHATIVQSAHNPVINGMYAGIASLTAEMMFRSLADPTVSREGLPIHRDIYQAIVNGDGAGARRAFAEHLEVAERHYGPDLERGIDEIARREVARIFGSADLLDGLLTGLLASD